MAKTWLFWAKNAENISWIYIFYIKQILAEKYSSLILLQTVGD